MVKKKTTKPETDAAQPLAPPAQTAQGLMTQALMAVVTGAEFAAVRVITSAEQSSGLVNNIDDAGALALQLREQAMAVSGGDMTQVEAMLMNQATALQSLFARLAERGMGCDYAPAFEANMRMALRAQSQCRATLETLSAIKNPPIVYARQANIAHGPQQVNNGVQAGDSRAHGNNLIQSNELSGAGYELLPDTRASQVESRVNSSMEAMAELNRATK